MKLTFSLIGALPALAVAQEAAPAAMGSNVVQTFVLLGVAMVLFYFILWRPEQKRRKVADQMRAALKKGDRVTAMGILGTIARVQDHTVILKLVEGAKVEVLKAAVTDVQPAAAEETDALTESSKA